MRCTKVQGILVFNPHQQETTQERGYPQNQVFMAEQGAEVTII